MVIVNSMLGRSLGSGVARMARWREERVASVRSKSMGSKTLLESIMRSCPMRLSLSACAFER